MAGDVIKVLLVDDIPETRENLRKLLAFETDIEVVGAASTGREGLEIAAATKPDVILMDINMPDMDGITATEEIKKSVPSAAVVMMSVQSESDYLRRAMLAGARDFLTKPISGDDLYSTIRRVYDLNKELRDQFAAVASAGAAEGGKKARKIGKAAGHIIAVYSPQGGSGVTTIATNMATAMMSEGTRVLLVDTDLQFGDVGVFLNLSAKHSLVELAQSVGDLDEDLIENVMVTHGSGLKVLLGPPSPEEAEKVNPKDLAEIVSRLASHYDYLIVDLPHRLDDATLNILDIAERIVVVANPTLPCIKNVRIILDLFVALQYPQEKIIFVMNRVNPDLKGGRASIPIEAIENNLKRKTDARIPTDDRVFLSAVNQGVSVIAKETNRSPARDLVELAYKVRQSFTSPEEEDEEDLMQQEQPKQSRLSGLFRR
ncbi:MAG: MinD/ParA family protein [Anaerolineae bacterium]|nr:MAG: MinD/ParA family protein [Anaerolineae bacterium]